MTSIMLWDRQNYFQTYEFELIRKWGFYLIPTTEEQRGENFLKAFLLNGLCFLLSLLALTHISSDAAIFMHFRYHLMPQKLVWNRFWLFSLSTGCRIFPFQIGIWYWIFLLILKLGLPEKKKGKCSLLTVHHKNPLHINCIGFDFYALANPVAGLGCNLNGNNSADFSQSIIRLLFWCGEKNKKLWRLLTFMWCDHFKSVVLSSLNKIPSIKEI